MLSLMLDRSDSNAPNQAMMFSNAVIDGKRAFLKSIGRDDMAASITLDSPIPYDLNKLLEYLNDKDTEMVPGANNKEKQGAYFGKLTRFIQRLSTKQLDKRLNFMFDSDPSLLDYNYMKELCEKLMSPSTDKIAGVKIIDFSEVPSDILPLIVSLLARLIFSVQQWTDVEKRHPIAIFCDEAHLYIPANTEKSIDSASLVTFERISKEGRKYGIGLVVISQRPSEVNRTVLSQSNNFIAMRLTNVDDQTVVKRLLPDSLGDYADMLPILDIGEALIVGDASLLPSRIKITPPTLKPRSATIDFWDEWSKESVDVDIDTAIETLRKQSK
jgi:Predicted ATPase